MKYLCLISLAKSGVDQFFSHFLLPGFKARRWTKFIIGFENSVFESSFYICLLKLCQWHHPRKFIVVSNFNKSFDSFYCATSKTHLIGAIPRSSCGDCLKCHLTWVIFNNFDCGVVLLSYVYESQSKSYASSNFHLVF